MLGVCNAITLAVETQLNEINIAIEQRKVANYFRFDDFFCNVKNKISVHALDLVLKQTWLARPLINCTVSFTKVYGLPCAHIVKSKILQNEELQEEYFCTQWQLFLNTSEISTDH